MNLISLVIVRACTSSQLGMKTASEVWDLINKCEANSSVSIYRNRDCLLVRISLSEQKMGHWQSDIFIS